VCCTYMDPVYRGVDIPLKFFKVAVFLHHCELAAHWLRRGQTPEGAELPDVPPPGVADEAPPLGPFRTLQTPIRDIGALTPGWSWTSLWRWTGCPSPQHCRPPSSPQSDGNCTLPEDLDLGD
jgi:hypothetical protein